MYRRRRIAAGIIAGIVVALLALGGYSVAVAVAPLPTLKPVLSAEVEASAEFEGDGAVAQAAVDAQSAPTAVGWLDGDTVWTNDDGQYRIASLTKLITVLVALEHQPIEDGSDGPDYTLTEADAALVDEVLAQNGTFAPAPVGTTLTTRQLLELILLPSANNYAIAYAEWVFGSNDAFIAAANEWLQQHELDSVHIVEPSGLSDDNVAAASDIVRIARLALANPVIAGIVSQSTAQIPDIGEIQTTNRLLGEPGVIGLKTGTTFPSGYSLAAAKQTDAHGREVVAIAVTLDRVDAQARADDTRATLAAVDSAAQQIELVQEQSIYGSITTWTGNRIDLIADSSASTVLLPSETATLSVALDDEAPASARQHPVGTIEITTPLGAEQVSIVTSAAIVEPDFWWRFTHPGELF